MQGRILEGKKIAPLLETEYIAEEVNYYHSFFSALGAQVDDLTYLWRESQRTLVSDVVQPGQMPETMVVTKDIADAKVEEYDIVLCAANYVACRLREIPPMGSLGSVDQLTTPPAVQFMIQAMDDSQIVKGGPMPCAVDSHPCAPLSKRTQGHLSHCRAGRCGKCRRMLRAGRFTYCGGLGFGNRSFGS